MSPDHDCEPDAESTHAHADTPCRWLVVFNAADTDSVAWAEHYRLQHDVPLANLCGLDLPMGEAITASQCDDLVEAVEQFVADNGLADRIMGVLLGHGVPGRYTRAGGIVDPVANALQRRDGGAGETINPLAMFGGATRPTMSNLAGDWITARIDGPTLADSVALVDRATAIASADALDSSAATLFVDFESGGGVYAALEAALRDWASSLDRQATRLPMITSDEQPIDAVANDGFVWAFGSDEPGASMFGGPAGSRVMCVPLVDAAATGLTLRDPEDVGWARRAMAAGYAAASATTRATSPSGLPIARSFFNALRAGWSLGEAWHVASPLLRAGCVLVGDPLMTVPLPRAGWNVYGPFASSVDVSFDQPLAMLRDDERSLALSANALPDEDDSSVFVIHRVDEMGRERRACEAAVVEGQ